MKEKEEWEVIFEQNLSIGKKNFQKPINVSLGVYEEKKTMKIVQE